MGVPTLRCVHRIQPLRKRSSRSSLSPPRCGVVASTVLDTSLIYLNWPSIEWHRTMYCEYSLVAYKFLFLKRFSSWSRIEILYIWVSRNFCPRPPWNRLDDGWAGQVVREIQLRVLKNGKGKWNCVKGNSIVAWKECRSIDVIYKSWNEYLLRKNRIFRQNNSRFGFSCLFDSVRYWWWYNCETVIGYGSLFLEA